MQGGPPNGNQLSTNKFDCTHVLVTPSHSASFSIAEPPPPIQELGHFGHNPNVITPAPGFIPSEAPPSYSQLANIPPTVHYSTDQRNVHVVVSVQMGPYPASLQCPHCHVHVVTDVVNRAGLLTWLICCGLALIGCWPFCFAPFCISKCQAMQLQDVMHFCPNCRNFLGKYSRI
ncbi:Lipopolysaccharide-induced tumor necrosis factor-alpha factor-like protein [Aphelenchoides fujianensis]|nr:Lipopolysaccharide-induced tumor necrosis factor-alpha factor-like protein [Aphelenchoides fujianensis]